MAESLLDRSLTVDPAATSRSGGRPGLWPRVLEAIAVLASPAVLFYILRIRAMAPPQGPDAGIESTYIIDPSQIFARYTAFFTPTARLREAARVGFLVPARIDYLLFGAVPGFYVTRYLFALVAVIPTYLLLRRMYCRAAGVIGILVIMTCPVILTAWGTDYPDSAVVSYSIGALACLAMPSSAGARRLWLAGAGVLLTMAVWAHGVGVVLAGSTLLAYGIVRFVRERGHLPGDVALLAGVAVVVTCALSVGSELLLGHFDFIGPTWTSFVYLHQPSQIAAWHSSNWRWAPTDPFILVPPAVLGAYAALIAARRKSLQTAHWIVGAALGGQVFAYWFMQFVGGLQTLEVHLFSSTLWGSTCIATTVLFAEIARPTLSHPVARWIGPAALIGVALAYEAYPHMPTLYWLPYGLPMAGLLVVIATAGMLSSRVGRQPLRWLCSAAVIAGVAACALVLITAKVPPAPRLAGIVINPKPEYAYALGGSVENLDGQGNYSLVDEYGATAELPSWVGPPPHAGVQLLTWYPNSETDDLWGPIGIYHAGIDTVYSTLGDRTLERAARYQIESRHIGQILMFGLTGNGFANGVRALGEYKPEVMKRGVLSYGGVRLHVMLIDLRRVPSWPEPRKRHARPRGRSVAPDL